MNTQIRYLLLAFGILVGIPLLLLLSLLPETPVSSLGIIYLSSYILIVLGMLFAPLGLKRSFVLILIGGILALATIGSRILFPASGSRINMVTLPDKLGPRLLNRVVNERDAVLFGAQIGPYVRFITSNEKKSLIPAFVQAYKEMNAYGATPLSPFLMTYLNQQWPDAFDVVIAEPDSETPPKRAIIFLHGFGGNFTIQCWLIAEPGFRINALTVCPSTAVNGQWWTPQGQAILQETLTYVHQRGIQQIYLAGLSNGAIGASRLAEQFKHELAGLILISGADPNATITGLPVLVLYGKNDERIPASMVENYVFAATPNVTYRPFDGDHFLLLKQATLVQEVIGNWLVEQETSSANH